LTSFTNYYTIYIALGVVFLKPGDVHPLKGVSQYITESPTPRTEGNIFLGGITVCKKMNKRLLSLLLAMSMIISTSIGVLAESTYEQSSDTSTEAEYEQTLDTSTEAEYETPVTLPDVDAEDPYKEYPKAAPLTENANYVTVTINFPGVEGVTINYHSSVSGWNHGIVINATDYAEFAVPVEYGTLGIQVVRGAMLHTISMPALEAGDSFEYNVPVATLRVNGFRHTNATFGIAVPGGWVYSNIPVNAVTWFDFVVFDNGVEYNVTLNRPGFQSITIPAGRVAHNDFQLNAWFNNHVDFIRIPAGVTNLWMAVYPASGNSWIVTPSSQGNMHGDALFLHRTGETARMSFDYNGSNYTVYFVLDGTDPFANLVEVNFLDVDGVTVRYSTNVSGWQTVATNADSTVLFALPAEHLPTFGDITIDVLKGPMTYRFTVNRAELDSTVVLVLDVPVAAVTVIGVSSAANIGITQSGWVYNQTPANIGVPNTFNVFDNGRPYTIVVGRTGFHNLNIENIQAGGSASLANMFYNIEIPAGVTNVRIANANWVDVTIGSSRWTTDGQLPYHVPVIALFRNDTQATLHYTIDGANHIRTFMLDGTNPLQKHLQAEQPPADIVPAANDIAITVNFPGVEGVQVRYSSNVSGWQTIAANADGSYTFELPHGHIPTFGALTVQVLRGPMTYSFAVSIDDLAGAPLVLDVPVAAITVIGVSSAVNIGISQSGWVYNQTPATVGSPNEFMVFDNGSPYTVVIGRAGYQNVTIDSIQAGGSVSIANLFYNIQLPPGVSNIRIANANWVDTTVWPSRWTTDGQQPYHVDVITLFRNYGNAMLHFTFNGENFSVPFVLDGTNPFTGLPMLPVLGEFGLKAFNNGNNNNPDLAHHSLLRIWTQIYGVGTPITAANLDVSAVLLDGVTCAMEFIRINHMWNMEGFVNSFNVDKSGDWWIIDLTAIYNGQEVTLRLYNNNRVLGYHLFNNGPGGTPSTANQSLADAGLIRIWLQIDNANTGIPNDSITITAIDQNDDDAMTFINIHSSGGFVNIIDANKNAPWQHIYLTVTHMDQTSELVLVNSLF